MTSPRHTVRGSETDTVWRPFDDSPLIAPGMAQGLVNPDQWAALRKYLRALVAVRPGPVHVTVAFNAVFFGYDTTAGGYVGGPLDFDDFPELRHDSTADALPVGAMVKLSQGTSFVPAEIIYKEGAHPLCSPEGEVPAWLSGAPGNALGPGKLSDSQAESFESRELLVPDTDAFGPGLVSASQISRLRRKGRLNKWGHAVVASQYATEWSDSSDLDYYAQFMLRNRRDMLCSSLALTPLPTLVPGDRPDDTSLERALRGLLDTIGRALRSLDDLRMWGNYAVSRESLADRLADDGPVGGEVLATVVVSAARAAVARDERRAGQPAYTALGPALRSRQDSEQHLSGVAYALAACHANICAADLSARESDEHTGLLHSPWGVRLRLDDRWHGGGVWRAEQVIATSDPLTREDSWPDVDVPLGLGWRQNTQIDADPMWELNLTKGRYITGELLDQVACAVDSREASDVSTSDIRSLTLSPSDETLDLPVPMSARDGAMSWSQPLRLEHILHGVLPVPHRLASELLSSLAHGQPRLLLAQARRDGSFRVSEQTVTCHSGERRHQLTGLAWPDDFRPGMLLRVTYRHGEQIVRVETTSLSVPETVDGEVMNHCYDRRVLTRDGATHRGRVSLKYEDLKPHELLIGTLRRLGLLDVQGRAMLPDDLLLRAVSLVFPAAPVESHRLGPTLQILLTTRVVLREHGSRDRWGRVHYPPRRSQPSVPLVSYVPDRRPVQRPTSELPDLAPASDGDPLNTVHRVSGHIRKLPAGWRASPEQQAAYVTDHQRFGLVGPSELPDGYTYVLPHDRTS